MKALLVLGVTAAAALSSPALATNLLTNGSFEDGLASWTVTHSVGTAPVAISYNNPANYPDGAFGTPIGTNSVGSASPDAVGKSLLYFSSDNNGVGALDSVSQSFDAIAGHTYNIGFDYYAPANGLANPNDAAFGLAIGGVIIGATAIKGYIPGDNWFNYATTYTAKTTGKISYDILFAGLGATSTSYAADIAIDRAYVTQAVPEPATWAMMLGGMMIVGTAMRRRRTAVSFG